MYKHTLPSIKEVIDETIQYYRIPGCKTSFDTFILPVSFKFAEKIGCKKEHKLKPCEVGKNRYKCNC